MPSNLDLPKRHDVYPFISPTGALAGSAANKSILITGAGTGIGREIAQAFAQAGASSLVLVGRRAALLEETAKLVVAKSAKCTVHIRADTDISSAALVDKLFQSLPGLPDVLVSNAARASEMLPITDLDPDTWWEVQETNLRGSYLLNRAYLKQIAAGKKPTAGVRPVIINVSSLAGGVAIPGNAAYSTSKAALNFFTECIAVENPQVTCVALHPGGIAGTEMSSAHASEALTPFLTDTVALAAGTTVYLATDRATYLHGRFVDGTGDMEELEQQKDRIIAEDLLKMRISGLALPNLDGLK